MKKNSLFIVLVCLFIVSCQKEKVPDLTNPNCQETVSYESEIKPIIQTYCISCHDVGNGTGVTLSNHTNTASNAQAVLGSLSGNQYMMMPQGGPPLADSLIQKIECWIYQGKLDN